MIETLFDALQAQILKALATVPTDALTLAVSTLMLFIWSFK